MHELLFDFLLKVLLGLAGTCLCLGKVSERVEEDGIFTDLVGLVLHGGTSLLGFLLSVRGCRFYCSGSAINQADRMCFVLIVSLVASVAFSPFSMAPARPLPTDLLT